MLPSLFIGHGAPTIIFDENKYTAFLKNYPVGIKSPKGVVIFSAHWESKVQRIGDPGKHGMIYDFYGFPEELYQVKYPAKSSAPLAQRVQQLLGDHGIPSEIDRERGMDHGAWTVLKLLYPDAGFPVVTMSVNPFLNPRQQYHIGRSLSALKEEGILIICSGGVVHNLGWVRFHNQGETDPWAIAFNAWIQAQITQWNMEDLFRYEDLAPNAVIAVPRNEHFINLLIALGTGDTRKKAELKEGMYQFGNLSLDFWEIE